MYHCLNNQVDNTTFRIFSPVVLFNDATAAEYSSDNQVIRLKKQRVNAMLKTNVEFWNNVIQTSRQQQQQSLEAPLSPLSVASSSSSFQSSTYHTPPSHQPQKDDETEDDEDDQEVDELDEDDESMDEEEIDTQHQRKHKRKPNASVSKSVTTATTTNSNSRKRRGNLPKNVTAILKQWLIDHCRHPYPTEEEKRELRLKTNLTLNQISNWFINARRRILPLILSAPVYQQQHEQENNRSSLKKKMRRKRGWMASSDKPVKQLCPTSSVSEML